MSQGYVKQTVFLLAMLLVFCGCSDNLGLLGKALRCSCRLFELQLEYHNRQLGLVRDDGNLPRKNRCQQYSVMDI